MKVALDKLPGILGRHHRRNMDRIDRGLIRAAQRGKAHMVKKTPTDQGQLRTSWKARGRLLTNDAPHAGIVEMGARPHPVSRAGVEAIKRWAQRNLGLGKVRDTKGRFVKTTKATRDYLEQEAWGVAWAIAAKIRREGQKPTFFIRSQLGELTKIAKQEVERVLKRRRK